MNPLSNARLKLWAQYYARLAGTAAWKGFKAWLLVALAGITADLTGKFQVSGMTWKGALLVLLFTILGKIALAWDTIDLPEPIPPAPPEQST